MDTQIFESANGRQYNRWKEEIIDCKNLCGRKTVMTGTKLCDFCWEAERKAPRTQS